MNISTGSLLADFGIVILILCHLTYVFYYYIGDIRNNRHLQIVEESNSRNIETHIRNKHTENQNKWSQAVDDIYEVLEDKLNRDQELLKLGVEKVKSDLKLAIVSNKDDIKAMENFSKKSVKKNNVKK